MPQYKDSCTTNNLEIRNKIVRSVRKADTCHAYGHCVQHYCALLHSYCEMKVVAFQHLSTQVFQHVSPAFIDILIYSHDRSPDLPGLVWNLHLWRFFSLLHHWSCWSCWSLRGFQVLGEIRQSARSRSDGLRDVGRLGITVSLACGDHLLTTVGIVLCIL